jgi:hypothetical protein
MLGGIFQLAIHRARLIPDKPGGFSIPLIKALLPLAAGKQQEEYRQKGPDSH